MNTKGFTLVEMIVSLAIFSVVAVVAIGALLKIIDANKKAQTIQDAVTNLNFALDDMSRDLRFGSTYDCSNGGFSGKSLSPRACPSGGSGLAFSSTKTIQGLGNSGSCQAIYAYEFEGSGPYTLEKAEQNECNDNIGQNNQAPFYPLLPSDVVITSYYLTVSGNTFPLAFIHITGYVGETDLDKSYFDVQTAISPRTP